MTEQAAAPGAAEAVEATPAPEAVEAASKPTEAPAEGAKPEAGATSEGTTPEGEKSTETAKEESTEQATEEITIEPPKELEQFKEDFATFSADATAWVKEHPGATAADALKWAAQRQGEAVLQQGQQMIQQHNERVEGWLEQAKADKEIGGDKFDQNVAKAIEVINKLGTDDLRQQLDLAGIGNHPDFLRLLVRAHKGLQQAPVLGAGGSGARKSFTESLYGTTG